MFGTFTKVLGAVAMLAAIGFTIASPAFAGSCSCSRGVGGTTYCSCR